MNSLLRLIAAALFLLSSTVHAACVITDDLSGTQSFTLYAGQNIDAGTVSVTVNGDNLEITYNTTGGWELTEVHAWVGTELTDIPQTNTGNPIPGQFPYTSGDITGQTSYTISVPLAELDFTCPSDDQVFYLAAHAALQKLLDDGSYETQTGWSDGDRIVDRGNWATYSVFTLGCDCDPGGEKECKTAYGYDVAVPSISICYLDIDKNGKGKFKRWGWTNQLPASGTTTLYLYAAALRCNVDAGRLAGTVTINNDGENTTVDYATYEPYTLNATHAYIGSTILPTDPKGRLSISPEHYPQSHLDLPDGTTTDSYTFEGTGRSDYGVFHASVCRVVDVR